MTDCIFCKIAEGKIPCYKIAEDSDFIAFLDIHPVNPGHVLIIPKKHYRWIYDIENFGKYFEFIKKVAKALQKAMKTEWIVLGVAGNDVKHAHVHLVPRFKGDGHGGFVHPENIKNISVEELKKTADSIRKAL
jgi:histidine triad (HIT) family protein